jgi:hypothetical protein
VGLLPDLDFHEEIGFGVGAQSSQMIVGMNAAPES